MSERHVYVDVILDDPKANPPRFHFETTDLPMGPDNHLYFRNYGHPGLRVHYQLKDGKGFLFPPNNKKDSALASRLGSSCPDQGEIWPTFRPIAVQDQRKTLAVRNDNLHEEDFGYSLFVTNDEGQSYIKLDPIGSNQNGPRLYSPTTLAAVAVGGAALSLVLAYTFDLIGQR